MSCYQQQQPNNKHVHERRCGFRFFLTMEQAVEFEPMDSIVFMLNTIANNIAQRNANYLTMLQTVSMFRASPTGPVNPFSQALCLLKPSHSTPSFLLFGCLATKARHQKRSRIESTSLHHVSCYPSNNMNIFAFRVTGHDVVMPAL